ncbi:iron ABC transporter substrate-binding protein [Metarhizobium album]|uniref:Iron ABC transporter substrate-binding protein n=1 Tax=Metarhizobium album TaxID=2182425 RepID=A0A2U2DMZ0_9HYPH|nr:siderophore ABC transporter substrate-binding protein [Rhizobium album]PWE54640.1 iron ABC transporter substrate-binding protein [Rhizobium album]
MLFNRSRLSLATVAALGALFVGGLAQAADLVVKHKQGETTIAGTPQKVVVFDLASLDTLGALGVEIQGVPGGVKPAYLSQYNDDKYVKVGTLFEPDYEAVNAAAPDLIIVAGRSAAKYGELAKIAPTIDLSVSADNFMDEAKNNVVTLATVFDKRSEADRLIGALDTSIAALKASAADKGKGLLVLTTGGKMSAFGPGSRFGMIHSVYGVQPAAETTHVGNHGQAISFEYILETNPDWLFVIDRDAAIGREGTAAAQYLDNEIVQRTKAWKNGHVVYLDAASWYLVGGGITAIQNTVDQLTSALNKG